MIQNHNCLIDRVYFFNHSQLLSKTILKDIFRNKLQNQYFKTYTNTQQNTKIISSPSFWFLTLSSIYQTLFVLHFQNLQNFRFIPTMSESSIRTNTKTPYFPTLLSFIVLQIWCILIKSTWQQTDTYSTYFSNPASAMDIDYTNGDVYIANANN